MAVRTDAYTVVFGSSFPRFRRNACYLVSRSGCTRNTRKCTGDACATCREDPAELPAQPALHNLPWCCLTSPVVNWDAVAQQVRADGLACPTGEMIVERPAASPNPVVEVRETLPDGTEFKAVWSHLRQSGVAKLVTVHFFDED